MTPSLISVDLALAHFLNTGNRDPRIVDVPAGLKIFFFFTTEELICWSLRDDIFPSNTVYYMSKNKIDEPLFNGVLRNTFGGLPETSRIK